MNVLSDIAHFEEYLTRQGTTVLKFFLHMSRKEQKKRLLARLDKPEKHWKFSVADLQEGGFWDDYMRAYEKAIRATASNHAPWFVVPADNKWFTRLVGRGGHRIIAEKVRPDLSGCQCRNETATLRRACGAGE
jgi:polyphosphate kinase 2 (PPK2 family)